MVSACINSVGMPPEYLIDRPPAHLSRGWISPNISFSRDMSDEESKHGGEKPDREDSEADFEFRLNDPVAMLSADELFSNGKLVPLQLAPILQPVEPRGDIGSVQSMHTRRREISEHNLSENSPKAPKCSSRWKEMVGLKKGRSCEAERKKVAAPPPLKFSDSKSLKQLLKRNPARSGSSDSTLRFPLLRDSDSESASISARASLSSSASSGAEHEDHPRLSLDLDRTPSTPLSLPLRAKLAKFRPAAINRPAEFTADNNINPPIDPSPIRRTPDSVTEGNIACRVGHCPRPQLPEIGELPPLLGASMDSPRLNACGKVIFQGLGRSSSSPSTFNGRARLRPHGMERSYSANVRVTPVLNVPVCTLRGTAKSASVFGLGQLFLPHKREKENSSAKNGTSNSNGAITKL